MLETHCHSNRKGRFNFQLLYMKQRLKINLTFFYQRSNKKFQDNARLRYPGRKIQLRCEGANVDDETRFR